MNILRVKKKAVELLERVEQESSYLHLVLQQEADAPTTAPDEYPVLVQLVRGVLEHREVIDDVLAAFLPKGLGSLPKPVLQTLRLGAYQILFLDRVKKRDVVFEAVELIKGGPFAGFSKLVNAVLRKVKPAAKVASSDGAASSLRNFPEWLVARWIKQFGEVEVEQFCEANNKPLPLYFRVNTARVSRKELQRLLMAEGVEVEPTSYSEVSLRVIRQPKDKRLQNLKSYQEGLFFVQDLSSTIVADIATNHEPRLVCDLCSAPGGKSCSMALSIARLGMVEASDRSQRRLSLVRDLTARLGVSNVGLRIRDAVEELPKGEPTFDAVLVDAPCSGFGTLGRKIDARWSKSEETIEELARIQAEILGNAAHLVKPGGFMVYSTCTIERQENEDIVAGFLSKNREFSLVDIRSELPAELCTAEGMYRAWPHRHAMAGAFAAKLRRR
jgi:16S rRNA (cytosine967-C5)-methyltransferase